MTLLVGTSGWQYADWRGRFYPPKLPQRAWLQHYLASFQTVEINATFYRLPKPEVPKRWAEESPADTVWVVKASCYLTHIKRLREPQEPVARLLGVIEPLLPRLGAILIQLPPRMAPDPANLALTLAQFPPEVRLAVEPRDDRWFTDEVWSILAERDAALVWSDRLGRLMTPLWRTASWGFLRMHEGRTRVWPFYGDQALGTWEQRMADTWPPGSQTSFVFFNNDPHCAAVANARTFGRIAARRGHSVSRVPAEPPDNLPWPVRSQPVACRASSGCAGSRATAQEPAQ
ncbi:MAG: DUF72 domain-containing protein [Actinomycetales bacterium]